MVNIKHHENISTSKVPPSQTYPPDAPPWFLTHWYYESEVGTMNVNGKQERDETGQASFCLWHIQSFMSLEEIA